MVFLIHTCWMFRSSDGDKVGVTSTLLRVQNISHCYDGVQGKRKSVSCQSQTYCHKLNAYFHEWNFKKNPVVAILQVPRWKRGGNSVLFRVSELTFSFKLGVSSHLTDQQTKSYPGIIFYLNACTVHLSLICTITNQCTIISQIITLLHVSTLLCHPQGACKSVHCQVTQVCQMQLSVTQFTMKKFHEPFNVLILNCVTKNCIWLTCVTWQGIDYERPEDDTTVSKHVGEVFFYLSN